MELNVGYRAFPGQCFNCGDCSSDARTVDVGVDPIYSFKRIYLCSTCVIATAQQFLREQGKEIVDVASVAATEGELVAARLLAEENADAARLLRELKEHVA